MIGLEECIVKILKAGGGWVDREGYDKGKRIDAPSKVTSICSWL